jgi:ribosome maturation factor RimP
MNNRKNIAGRVAELIAPAAKEAGLVLWDVEFVREGARQVLRVTIDSPDGIGIDDCERFHRMIDPLLDSADPIESSYYLEISSPGIERELKTEAHFEACTGCEVEIKLYVPDKTGKKTHRGKLAGLVDGRILLDTPTGRLEVDRVAAARVRTVFDFDDDNMS